MWCALQFLSSQFGQTTCQNTFVIQYALFASFLLLSCKFCFDVYLFSIHSQSYYIVFSWINLYFEWRLCLIASADTILWDYVGNHSEPHSRNARCCRYYCYWFYELKIITMSKHHRIIPSLSWKLDWNMLNCNVLFHILQSILSVSWSKREHNSFNFTMLIELALDAVIFERFSENPGIWIST